MKTSNHFLRRLRGGAAVLAMLLLAAAWPAVSLAQAPITLLNIHTNIWRYNDSGADLGTAWREVVFTNESAWRTGVGLFGVEPTVPYPYPVPVRTPLVLGGGRLTYYFRAHFTVAQNPSTLVVNATAYADDGAVFYMNGTEVGRVRIPFDPVYPTTRATLANPEGVAFSFNVPSSAFVMGDNVMAVEIHQNAITSSDVIFGLALQATFTEAPLVLTPDEPADRVLAQGESTVLAVAGSGTPAPAYYWYHDGSLVPGVSGPALALNNVRAGDAGAYFVVLSNALGTAMSRVAQVTVLLDTNPPVFLYALGGDDLTKILLPLTEAPDLAQAEDPFNWQVGTADGSTTFFVQSAAITEGTNVTLTTIESRDPAVRYVVQLLGPISDLYGNSIPPDTTIPVATFPSVLMPLSQVWRYDQSGVDPGAAWRSNTFNDLSWLSGPGAHDAVRDFPHSLPPLCRTSLPVSSDPVGTCLSLSNANNTAQLPAIYFRTRFNFTGDSAHTVLRLQTQVDDGAVFYLNGAELCRIGIPEGPISHDTPAARTIFNAVNETLVVSGAGLRQGENVLAVEVHQDSLTSPDLTFGLRLNAVLPELVVQPQLAYGLSGGNVTVTWTPAVGVLQAADAVSGPWSDITPSNPPNQHTEQATADRRFYRVLVP